MTQKQLDLVNFQLNLNDITHIDCHLSEHKVVCFLSARFSIVLKRTRGVGYILLKSGKKCLKIPADIFDAMCNAQTSVNFLMAYLEQYTTA